MARIAEPTPSSIDEAAERLKSGRVVAFPTETVYGLGASTFDADALAVIYHMKGRSADNPLIAHVRDASVVPQVAEKWDDRCTALAERFWPGPLTLVLPKREAVPARATAGLPTIAVRAPRHPVAQALLRRFDGPVSAPSANRSGHVSPTTARHVADDFAETADLLVLDGGSSEIGLESTVLDVTSDPPRILRPGTVTPEELREVLGPVQSPRIRAQAASPGTSPRHYAPALPVELVSPEGIVRHLKALADPAVVLCFDASTVPPPHRACEMPRDADEYARKLYEALRRADASECAHIVIETPPDTNDVWLAIHDRLERACAP